MEDDSLLDSDILVEETPEATTFSKNLIKRLGICPTLEAETATQSPQYE